ncbi:MAG: hypothetical protein R3F11_31715 [Verrucomicrobiales bacterium]
MCWQDPCSSLWFRSLNPPTSHEIAPWIPVIAAAAALAMSPAAHADLVINEIDCDTPGNDTREFIELLGDPNQSLTGYVIVLYNGNSPTDASYRTIDLAYLFNGCRGFICDRQHRHAGS